MQVRDEIFLDGVLAILAVKRIPHYRLAQMVGVSRGYLSFILRGERPLPEELQRKIVEVLKE